jgi:hypothetical protein
MSLRSAWLRDTPAGTPDINGASDGWRRAAAFFDPYAWPVALICAAD